MFYNVLMAFTTLVIDDYHLKFFFYTFILSMYLCVIYIPFQIVYSLTIEVGGLQLDSFHSFENLDLSLNSFSRLDEQNSTSIREFVFSKFGRYSKQTKNRIHLRTQR